MAKDSTTSVDAYAKAALERIENCRKCGGQELDLSHLSLSTLPPVIGDMKGLRVLDLSVNRLPKLLPDIGQLEELTTLTLSRNHLTSLPPEIGKLTALTTLAVNNNRLTTLPPEIGNLTALTTLTVNNNQITTLPPEIGNLTALMALFLHNNALTSLPTELAWVNGLTKLDVHNNVLTSLPPEIGKLGALTELFLRGNPELGIPESVLSARPSDILEFYFERRMAAATGTLRSLNEIKVMLVGRGGAGKTSLRRYFMEQPHNNDEKETPGIALDSFSLHSGQKDINVRLWDFAGQEITHALHHFFLTEGCVYVLVLDPRSNTEGRDADYWLGLLMRYANGAPVLIALNRQDGRQGGYDVDRNALKERFPNIRGFIATNCKTGDGCRDLRQALADVVESLGNDEPPNLKVPEAWIQVTKECFGVRHGEFLEEGWSLARFLGISRNKQSSQFARQHLSLEEFRQLCVPHGVVDKDKQESLARLLHKLGAVLHFIDEPRLRDTAVLNPHWVTDAVYRLLRAKDHSGSDGILTLDDALTNLPGESEVTTRFLLRLMERFDMCFPLDEEAGSNSVFRWLVPGAMTEFQPVEIGPEWRQAERVRLLYRYDPLPEGVLPRFIVLTRLLSERQPRWRHGVMLQEGAARALVRRDRENVVEVTAIGPEKERLRLLEIVQGNLNRIHADLPRPKPVAEIELAQLAGTFRPVADLEAAEIGKQRVAVKMATGENVLVEPTPQLNRASEPEARDGSRFPLNVFLSYSHKDKTAKDIFRDNLTVMEQKKFIAFWHDGLIGPGMRWREEIEENLEKMDVFVGLLTTAYLASNFIQTVELKAVREKLKSKGQDFLFVLILVDDISLEDLDLAEYQLLKPGDRAVTSYASRKAGFNAAQKKLESLFKERQEWNRTRKGEIPEEASPSKMIRVPR